MPEGTTKEQVIAALAKIEGCKDPQKSYERWMVKVRPSCPDDDTAHKKIIQTILLENWVTRMKDSVDRTKDRLLHNTDHHAVLAASRSIIRRRWSYEHDPAVHSSEPQPEISYIAGDNPKLPSAVLKLHAARIMAFDDRIIIEFGGGFHHQGFFAYAEGVADISSDDGGFHKMIDGLWFYEDTQ